MKRSFFVLCAVLVSFTFSSCDLGDDGPNFHFVPLQIVSADLPESFTLNETYEIKVTYLKPDGCTYYSGFDIVKPEITTRNVVAIGSQRTDQDVCTQVVEEKEASFNFIVIYDQTYLFRFWQSENENGEQQYFEVEVPVN
jgi:hypothetical protein